MQSTLICDLDNTLYDWVAYFVPSFYAMTTAATRIIECDENDLLDQLRDVHQLHHNSEHPFALLETPLVQCWLTKGNTIAQLEPAFQAFSRERRKRLVAYPGVHETLKRLRSAKVRLIAHSDSNLFGVIDRLSRLQLTDYFDLVYCVESAVKPHPTGGPHSSRYKQFPEEKIKLLSRNEKKPNPAVLNHIVSENDLDRHTVAYIGDSLTKDILMAKSTGIVAYWAKYGTRIDAQLYSKLVRISHWTKYDVEQERNLLQAVENISPDYVCDSFEDVLVHLS
ncbi:HAD family hydrolase [Agrobacterium salinitolerans]|uniref:phosphoglycolate phosphatase n=1 Tax=Agrobacterium salinitolerans TaxID=1183413 RepID=A0ABY3BRY4_9HYPH|nr:MULTISPECIES: HAD family hydrolase [Agrobacterium]MCZ7891894.1 HAD family hydrolase [Agrobacterium salinitolerans]TRA94054.1 HAD family hydrolase [Agrobacterium salinitolerans]